MTLDEIYERLTLFSPQEREELKALEVDCERRVLSARHDVQRMFEKAVAHGKRVVVSSDMYLSSKQILELLEKNGYRGIERAFVSCEWSCEKTDGRLLSIVASELDVRPDKILHVGDSLKADARGARLSGVQHVYVGDSFIDVFLNRTMRKLARPAESWELNPLIEAACRQESTGFEVGFRAVAPLMYGFCSWLHGQIKSAGDVDGVFFLARDANLLYEAYGRMFPCEIDQLHYIHLSRKTCYPVLLSTCDSVEDIFKSIALPRYLSLRMLGECLGVVQDDGFETIASSNGLKMDLKMSREELFDDARVRVVIEQVLPSIKQHAEEQSTLLVQYLLQRGFGRNSVIVDDGWHGTCQRCLERAVGWPLRGYYLGTSDTCDLSAFGYLYDDNRKGIDEQLAGFGGLFEMLMSTGEGPTIAYRSDADGVVSPVFGDSELSRESLSLIEEVRRGALSGVRSLHSVFEGANVGVDPIIAFAGLEKLGDRPSLVEVELFGSVQYANNGAVFRLVPSTNLLSYAEHPMQFKVDFFDSTWKTGFLKQLFRFPLDYGIPYRILRNAFHKYEG